MTCTEQRLSTAEKQKQKADKLKASLPEFAASYIDSIIVPTTRLQYARNLVWFFGYLTANGYPDILFSNASVLDKIGAEEVNAFLDSKQTKNSAKNTASFAIKGLYKYCRLYNKIDGHAVLDIKTYPNDKGDVVRMRQEEVKAFVDIADGTNDPSISRHQRQYIDKEENRDRAIIYLILNTGIRATECTEIDMEDLNLQLRSVRITAKGNFEREAEFNTETKRVLEQYISHRNAMYPALFNTGPLFLSLQGRRMTVRALEKMVKKYGTIIGRPDLTVHALRRATADRIIEKTGDYAMVADTLGHYDLYTVRRGAADAEANRRVGAELDIVDRSDLESEVRDYVDAHGMKLLHGFGRIISNGGYSEHQSKIVTIVDNGETVFKWMETHSGISLDDAYSKWLEMQRTGGNCKRLIYGAAL